MSFFITLTLSLLPLTYLLFLKLRTKVILLNIDNISWIIYNYIGYINNNVIYVKS